MAELINIKIEGDDIFGKESQIFDMKKAEHMIRDAVDDIADAVETQVDRTVPVNLTGKLKAHPVERDDTRIGIVEPGIFQFASGGGAGIPGARGAGGRFVRGEAGLEPGQIIARSTLAVPKIPKYAIWVHDGTGIYKPGGSGKPLRPKPPNKFMKFDWYKGGALIRKSARFESVRGQQPQPYLDNAWLLIERTFVPVRLAHLRAQIAALT